MAKPSLWQRLVREAQRPGSVALAGLGTALLAGGVVNPLLAAAAAPVYAAWGVLLVSRVFRTPDLRGDAIKEIEAQLEEVAKLRYGAAHPPKHERSMAREAARVRERFDELMAELDIARGRKRPEPEQAAPMSAEEFESRLRQFRRICAGEETILNRLRSTPSGISALPAGLLADVTHLVNWAEAISRQRADYLLTLTQHPIEGIQQRIARKEREIARAPADERKDLEESLALLEAAAERHKELQREVRSIENQLDMIESLIQNLILSTPNVPSAHDQIMRVKRNVETYQTVNREVRERLAQRPTLASMLGSGEARGT
jgi:DNA repair exonuclease SbcCD ATPase subunit